MTPTPPPTHDLREAVARDYVLMKRGLYWRPDGCGYTGVLAEAGRYTKEQAEARVDSCCKPSVTAHRAEDCAEFSPACWPETQIAVLRSELARLTGQIDELQGLIVTAEICAERAIARALAAEAELATLRAERDAANAKADIWGDWIADAYELLNDACMASDRDDPPTIVTATKNICTAYSAALSELATLKAAAARDAEERVLLRDTIVDLLNARPGDMTELARGNARRLLSNPERVDG